MSIDFDPTDAIVVGTDLSDRAGVALDWAARRSATRRQKLMIVLAIPEVPIPSRRRLFEAMETGDWPAHLRERARVRLDDLAAAVASAHPEVPVETVITTGRASSVLAQASTRAALVVVGARGETAPLSVRALGGTADAVVQHAHGPVAVVTDLAEQHPDGPIVVGVVDPPQTSPALEFAANEAVAHDVRLEALHAWDMTPWLLGSPFSSVGFDPAPLETRLHAMVEDELAPLRAAHPGLDAAPHIMAGHAARLLIERSAEASAVVVGTRGLGGFSGLLLGSTSRAVLREAHCPVIVVRTREAQDEQLEDVNGAERPPVQG